jgi:hypothetical protein
MDHWRHSGNSAGTRDDLRRDACLIERSLDQTIEVGREDNSDPPSCGQRGQGVVSCRRLHLGPVRE